MADHKKFFDKAKDSNYVKHNFLLNLRPLEERQGKELKSIANEYFEKKNRKAKKKDPQVKQAANIKWDFSGSSGGDHANIAKQES